MHGLRVINHCESVAANAITASTMQGKFCTQFASTMFTYTLGLETKPHKLLPAVKYTHLHDAACSGTITAFQHNLSSGSELCQDYLSPGAAPQCGQV